jgi:hypothetical protein
MILISDIIQKWKVRKFLQKKLPDVYSLNLDLKTKAPVHIITVAYNNELLLPHQYRLLKKNIKDEFVFIVADNSSDPSKRRRIEEFCKVNRIGYIALPQNPFTTSSSSHGVCLNWMFENYISVVQPPYFGFIDHDIYPVVSHSLIDVLNKQNVYGQHQGAGDFWFLWAGLCFFKYSAVQGKPLNFLPSAINGVAVDTGGANWKVLYSGLNKSAIKFPAHQYLSLREGEIVQSDKMEMIGEWLHSFNGSGWMKINPKDNLLNDYLEKL